MTRSTLLRLGILLLLVLGAAVALFFPAVKDALLDFVAWVRHLGAWGPIVLALAYTPASLVLFPGSVLTLGAGFAFGVVVGTVAVSAGSTLAAAVAFAVGRYVARDWVERKVAGHPRFQALDAAVAAEGFKIVLLTRLSPLFPFTILNYAYGLTRVRFRDYLVASWLGMLPGTIMYVYLGSAVEDLAALAAGRVGGGTEQRVLFFLGLAATVAVTIVVTRLARRALRQAVPDSTGGAP